MPNDYHYGHLLVVNAHSFTDCPEIQKLTGSTDVKPINLIITENQDGQLLYEVLGLALKQLSLLPIGNHFRLYHLSGNPRSAAYQTRDDFIRALMLPQEDFLHLMTGVFQLDTLDQIEALLQRYTDQLDTGGAGAEAYSSFVAPIQQAVTDLRRDHDDRLRQRLGGYLANQW